MNPHVCILVAFIAVSFVVCNAHSTSRYRYKVEIGAYIDAIRKETFSICPDKEIQGTWISEHSVALDEKNCLSVQAPNIAGTFRILFLQNSGKTDTIQVLVEQSYIPMGDYYHQIWVADSMPSRCRRNHTSCEFPAYGHYEGRKYSQPLIVDKTKFTMGDAQYYSKSINVIFSPYDLKEYPKNEKLEESKLPYIVWPGQFLYEFANERSKKEGLKPAYYMIDRHSEDIGKFLILGDTDPNKFDAPNTFLAVDTLASGYRLPFDDEWLFLMRAGSSTRYYWGNEEDSITVSRYAWVRPIGLKPIAQLLPNSFGLYDMIGIAKEATMNHIVSTNNGKHYDYYDVGLSGGDKYAYESYFIKEIEALKQYTEISDSRKCIGKMKTEGEFEWKCEEVEQKPIVKTMKSSYSSFRLLRKTPKLHKLEKF